METSISKESPFSHRKSSVLYSSQRVQSRIKALGRKLNRKYRDRTLIVLAVLNGSLPFVADLLKYLPDVDVHLETVRVRSYENNRKVRHAQCSESLDAIRKSSDPVLIVDDVFETGETLKVVMEAIGTNCSSVRPVETIVLLKKPGKPKCFIELDYVGFTLSSQAWVYGYGMDLDGRERHRQDIRVLS